MSELIAVAYDNEARASEVLQTLRKLQQDYLIDLEDAVYVTKDQAGQVHIHQSTSMAGLGAASGGFWGFLFGLIFLVPIVGLIIGAGIGALAGRASDYGIDDNFVKQLSTQLRPGTSALFILVRKSTPDKVLAEVGRYGGTVMHTTLSKETEDKLQAALKQQPQQQKKAA